MAASPPAGLGGAALAALPPPNVGLPLESLSAGSPEAHLAVARVPLPDNLSCPLL